MHITLKNLETVTDIANKVGDYWFNTLIPAVKIGNVEPIKKLLAGEVFIYGNQNEKYDARELLLNGCQTVNNSGSLQGSQEIYNHLVSATIGSLHHGPHYEFKKGHYEILYLLLSQSPQINVDTIDVYSGYTALQNSARIHQNPTITALLLIHGANPLATKMIRDRSITNKTVWIKASENSTAIDDAIKKDACSPCTAYLKAAVGDALLALFLLNQNVCLPYLAQILIATEHSDLLHQLLDDPRLANQLLFGNENTVGYTPLQLAIIHKQTQLALKIMSLDTKGEFTKDIKIILALAVEHRQTEIVNEILSKRTENFKNDFENCLMIAIENDDTEIIKSLVQSGASCDVVNSNNEPGLLICLKNKYKQAFNTLLDCNADPDCILQDNKTALTLILENKFNYQDDDKKEILVKLYRNGASATPEQTKMLLSLGIDVASITRDELKQHKKTIHQLDKRQLDLNHNLMNTVNALRIANGELLKTKENLRVTQNVQLAQTMFIEYLVYQLQQQGIQLALPNMGELLQECNAVTLAHAQTPSVTQQSIFKIEDKTKDITINNDNSPDKLSMQPR